MAAALKLRSHDDETSSNEKQTRDSPRVQDARVLVSLGKSKNGSNVVPRTWNLVGPE